ncbi:Acyltransferase invovled in MEL production [Sporisorium reilianum f. sp. reilianum]|uniref:Acyltransferase invovled in MEL production n=1 Tax=Sporisorium reilianum f. sp. reilianum TaxID=72559 RepID=A0A2N8UF23_9BASI|nr:Acyltransferase invovled in MEL production [Sporisorium reilianum f. sp. reilianum]
MINNALRTLVHSVTEEALDDVHEHNFAMATQAQQIDPYEWHYSGKDVWERTCLGHEASASFNQNIAHGHTELSPYAGIRIHHPSSSRIAGTELELDELVARIRQAWIQTRYLRPEVAVELDRHADATKPQTMSYKVLRDEEALQQWLDETFVVKRLGEPDAETFQQLAWYTYNRPLPTQGKKGMLYLVLPRLGEEHDGGAHLVLNVSHAVTDGGSIVDIFNVLLQCMIDATPSEPYDSIYTPSTFELNVLPRLPRSVVSAYQQQHKPKPADVAAAKKAAADNMRLIADKMDESLALLPSSQWNERKHETICLAKVMEPEETRELFRFAKQVHAGVTYLASAATILATAETYPERKASSQGALMGMVRNARRWVSSPSIPLGSDAVFLWIPVNTQVSLEPSYNRLADLVSVAGVIRQELDKHLTTPHCIASYATVADASIAGLQQQWSQIRSAQSSASPSQKKLDSIIGAQAPGFSSVGMSKVHPRFQPISASARASGLWLERWDFAHTGRQVNASPWISMLTVDGKLKFQLGFDAKFHEVERMRPWLDRTFAWMQICAAAASATTTTFSSSPSLNAPVSARL